MITRLILTIVTAAMLFVCGALFIHSKYAGGFPTTRNECVVLLHGLCRSARSMKIIENHLKQNGYALVNIDYASTRKSIAEAADQSVAKTVAECKRREYDRIHFVTHSLGAIIVRQYLQDHQVPQGSRIVMLGPPNQGSELADWAQNIFPRLSPLAGPAANHLRTGQSTLLSELSPLPQEVGVIIGNDSWNPIFSKILPGLDDGKVTVDRAKLDGMRDFLVAPCNHTTILLNREVLQNVVTFLRTGQFIQSDMYPRQK